MEIIKILNQTTRFLIDPSHHDYSPVKQGLAWITTIAVAILSLGIIHGLSVAWRQLHLHPAEKNDTHEKISKIFDGLFNAKQNEQTNRTPDNPPREEIPYTPEYLSLVKTIDNDKELKTSIPDLRQDVVQHLLGFTDDVTFSHLTTASKGVAQQISINAINQIRDILAAAIQIDEKIKGVLGETISIIGTNEKGQIWNEIEANLSTNFFKFDFHKWESVVADLNTANKDNKIVINSSYLIEECKLDLLEALAEYNVRSYHIKNNQKKYENKLKKYLEEKNPPEDFIIKISAKKFLELNKKNTHDFERQNRFLNKLFEASQSDKTLSPSAREILEEAKKLGKVSLHVQHIQDFTDTFKNCIPFAKNADFSPLGPYLNIAFLGCECTNGFLPHYLTNADNLLHIDWLIGKKQGDRLILSTTDGQPFIIRLNQINTSPLEDFLLNEICGLEASRMQRIKWANTSKNLVYEYLPERKALFQKAEKAYGKETVDQYMKNRDIKAFLEKLFSQESTQNNSSAT